MKNKIVHFELKQKNMFIVRIDGIPSHMIYKLSNLIYRDGKWDPIEISLYDIIGPSTYQILDEIKNLSCIDLNIERLDSRGNIVSEIKIVGKISYIDFGEFNWEINDISKCIIKIIPHEVKIDY